MKKGISVSGVYGRARDFVILLVFSAIAFVLLSILDNLAQ